MMRRPLPVIVSTAMIPRMIQYQVSNGSVKIPLLELRVWLLVLSAILLHTKAFAVKYRVALCNIPCSRKKTPDSCIKCSPNLNLLQTSGGSTFFLSSPCKYPFNTLNDVVNLCRSMKDLILTRI